MTIAKYIRLSVEDAKTDSLSIENQRLLLDRFISGQFPDADVLEFVDNGYSGTNFERPGIRELFSQTRQGRVNCIVVKDFSRFGRSSIETGYYMEKAFPALGVRFIAVSDGYDSAECADGICGVDVMFKFLINELYSRDLSMKIKSARAVSTRRGEYLTKNCPYGYTLNAARKLEPNPTAAEVVRMIFQLAYNGESTVDIRDALFEAKIPTPSEYKKGAVGPTCQWNTSVILKILHDEQYVGTYVAGKKEALDVGSRQVIRKDEREWVKIPNHHPAIIEQAIFEKVQERFGAKKQMAVKRRRPRCDIPLGGALLSIPRTETDATGDPVVAEKQRLYERFVQGEISAAEFKALKVQSK